MEPTRRKSRLFTATNVQLPPHYRTKTLKLADHWYRKFVFVIILYFKEVLLNQLIDSTRSGIMRQGQLQVGVDNAWQKSNPGNISLLARSDSICTENSNDTFKDESVELPRSKGVLGGLRGVTGRSSAAHDDDNEKEEERKVFAKYDVNSNGKIEIHELEKAMEDLGLLDGKSRSEKKDSVVATFTSLDVQRKNGLNLEQFARFWRRANAPKLRDVLMKECPEIGCALKEAFVKWSTFGSREQPVRGEIMTSQSWMKLCRDVGLVGRKKGCLGSSEADLVFAKVKVRGRKKISFSQFVDAVMLVAQKMEREVMTVVHQILESGGPVVNGTVVTAPKFSPKSMRESLTRSTWGSETPSLVSRRESSSYSNAAAVTTSSTSTIDNDDDRVSGQEDNSPNEDISMQGLENVKKTLTSKVTEKELKMIGCLDHHTMNEFKISTDREYPLTPEKDINGDAVDRVLTPSKDDIPLDSEALLRVYGDFASFGKPRMQQESIPAIQMELDGKQFAKLCRDSGLSRGPKESVKVDLCFAKARSTRGRKLLFEDFLVALALLASEFNVPEDDVFKKVSRCRGPRRNSNTPDYCRLHDDKSTFTGVYARGGPDVMDGGKPDLAKILQGR